MELDLRLFFATLGEWRRWRLWKGWGTHFWRTIARPDAPL
jgi:hypothetical protein